MIDLREQLALAFAAEHAEHVAAIRVGLALADAGGTADMRDVYRRAHSLKGAARAVDRTDIEELAHNLESLLADGADGPAILAPATIEAARALLDAIEDALAPVPATADETEDDPGHAALVRISAGHVEALAECVRALQADLESRSLIASDLRDTRAEIEAIRTLCLAPGARLPDVAARLTRLLAGANTIAGRRIAADIQVERTAGQLATAAERVLLAPAAMLAEGQARLVRAIAAEAGREAELIVADDGAEADRRVLQALRDPVNHLLRNAIGHGIETADARRRAGKPARGRITLSLRAERGRLRVAVEDDGPGPDIAAIVAAARARGGIAPDEAAPTGEQALRLVFEHGLSTSGGVDRLSGRGVGLAVVADAARRLDGTTRMLRAAGGGTRVEIDVPLTQTRRPVLLVEAGGQTFALPTRAAARAIRFDSARIEMREGRPVLAEQTADGDRLLPVASLALALGLAATPLEGWVQAIVMRDDDQSHVVVVDALSDVRMLAFGDASAIAIDVPLILGAASVEDGRLALVLSPELLLERIARAGRSGVPLPRSAAPHRQPTILVVDDSITTRTLERGILEAQGYRVVVAVDGIAGLEALHAAAGTIDCVVADVEMPRMDGFGLLSAIRNDPVFTDIPVIMMTSRDSPEDIQRGLDLGADAYVTKQAFEQGALLATIGRLI